jgi:hypothetical protein
MNILIHELMRHSIDYFDYFAAVGAIGLFYHRTWRCTSAASRKTAHLIAGVVQKSTDDPYEIAGDLIVV